VVYAEAKARSWGEGWEDIEANILKSYLASLPDTSVRQTTSPVS
jgi:hypothetical protein